MFQSVLICSVSLRYHHQTLGALFAGVADGPVVTVPMLVLEQVVCLLHSRCLVFLPLSSCVLML